MSKLSAALQIGAHNGRQIVGQRFIALEGSDRERHLRQTHARHLYAKLRMHRRQSGQSNSANHVASR